MIVNVSFALDVDPVEWEGIIPRVPQAVSAYDLVVQQRISAEVARVLGVGGRDLFYNKGGSRRTSSQGRRIAGAPLLVLGAAAARGKQGRGSLMDPDMALARIRELIGDGSSADFLLVQAFEDLDEWLSKGGYLPVGGIRAPPLE